ncbi:hypothetical protein TVAG_095390 [Trichomonas vaginalis G3]|uniref:Auto-transporter adhesin head GIN domain-containing protein n=1 Tax=Trichomonas vaginalis (strain ATCC PRA-98 / G3) TaxID=412133 RepID=A2G6D2_TRIV3|nr:hypothetical protein TVAGG3_0318360 [Trichomonas vaginalis G3]EAX87280.1 hypothetical protein TVAG_095390 [Trichomonas vaginalis G3]KAI5529108.1 hypothetical protein TVAGG3_0318360 [Trichomonas vaginalis G3]|eukprot:XP_001300210.1 hypothetical protein [Trichomonas vaginalis G3]
MFFLFRFASSISVCVSSQKRQCPTGYEQWNNQYGITELLVYNSTFNLDLDHINMHNISLVLGKTNITLTTTSNESQIIENLTLSNAEFSNQSAIIINGNITVANTNSQSYASLIGGTYGNITGVVFNISAEFIPGSFIYRTMTDYILSFRTIPKNVPTIVFQQRYEQGIPRYLETFFYGSKSDVAALEKRISEIFRYEKNVDDHPFWIHHELTSKYLDVYLTNIDLFMRYLLYFSAISAGLLCAVFIVFLVYYCKHTRGKKEAPSAYLAIP